jgi:hypothetical protein
MFGYSLVQTRFIRLRSCKHLNWQFFSTALPAHSGPWPLIQFRNHLSKTVGPLRRVISSSQGLYLNTRQHKHRINAHTHTHTKHSCLEWDSNPRSQRSSERRHFMPQTARPLWPADISSLKTKEISSPCEMLSCVKKNFLLNQYKIWNYSEIFLCSYRPYYYYSLAIT